MDHFRKKFLEEATEHINDLERTLLELENDSTNIGIIERVFRAMHSLKGGGAMFGFEKVSEFTHNLETVYDLIRTGQVAVTKEILNITLASVDHLKGLLNEENEPEEALMRNHASLSKEIARLALTSNEVKSSPKAQVTADNNQEHGGNLNTYYIHFLPNENIFDNGTNPLFLIDELYGIGNCEIIPRLNKIPEFNQIEPTKCYTHWDVFLATSSDINAITDVFIFVEDDCELEVNKIADFNILKEAKFIDYIKSVRENQSEILPGVLKELVASVKPVAEIKDRPAVLDRNTLMSKDATISSIRVSSDKLDLLMNLVSELVTTQARLALYSEQDSRPELMGISENVQKLSRQLRDIAFSIVLIPIENMLTRFQRLVRDLSNELRKEVDFIAEGVETELDKTIIENLTDPLMHILRNSMDHGIEEPAIREKSGKPRRGTIQLKAFYSGANVHIQISDDGAGINPEMIRSKAISKGIISIDSNLSRKEILDLIFLPGFSTAAKVTDVSGRGVGMDVVRRKIADIRGEVEVESEPGKGTIITIKLPLTLSIIDGLLVKIDEIHYVLPLTAVDKIYAVDRKTLFKSFNNIVVLDGEQFPYFYLRREFGLDVNSDDYVEQVVLVKYEDKRIGIVVDYVVGEYQAVLKPLGKHYKQQDIISGATILGDGTIALVMDTNKAIKQFANQTINTEEIK
jgi:two-component system, chemotaxis family, sensor kinase CheA